MHKSKSRAVVNGGACDDRDTASLWSERAIFRRKMLRERPGLSMIYIIMQIVQIGGRYERETAGTHSYGVHSN